MFFRSTYDHARGIKEFYPFESTLEFSSTVFKQGCQPIDWEGCEKYKSNVFLEDCDHSAVLVGGG